MDNFITQYKNKEDEKVHYIFHKEENPHKDLMETLEDYQTMNDIAILKTLKLPQTLPSNENKPSYHLYCDENGILEKVTLDSIK